MTDAEIDAITDPKVMAISPESQEVMRAVETINAATLDKLERVTAASSQVGGIVTSLLTGELAALLCIAREYLTSNGREVWPQYWNSTNSQGKRRAD